MQDTLWHLSEGDFSATHFQAVNVKEASADMDALRAALKNLLKIFWANIGGEGSHLLSDFTSFMRLALADFAEALEVQAAHTKESLRESESEVQRGERDSLGRKHKTPEEEREGADPKAKFEKTMDTVKAAGSGAIGVGQSVKVTAEERASSTRARLTEAFYQVRLKPLYFCRSQLLADRFVIVLRATRNTSAPCLPSLISPPSG